ncbi:hypothetical protein GLIP_2365 [Aliiglaciecola lipolytica E3]|uniref:Uncharacterized protein n=1 Tax=Aliiglaciecola lipolytica E3 TaxID=1127673 RepID=K6XTI2_9ALTE|nr:hypothetical protein GLIP_2365 [Aliiglaciecola lipolytica E3]
MLDGQCQWSIHKGHVAINQCVVTDKIGQLQSTVRSNLLNRPIQSRSNLANKRGLPASRGACNIQTITVGVRQERQYVT